MKKALQVVSRRHLWLQRVSLLLSSPISTETFSKRIQEGTIRCGHCTLSASVPENLNPGLVLNWVSSPGRSVAREGRTMVRTRQTRLSGDMATLD